jgi:DNA-binding response OmpR family regulator
VAILRLSGFTPFGFENPRDALRASESDDPALLIADVVMPHMTGIELAIQVQSKYLKCKVLLLSGRTISADLLDQANKGGHHFALLANPLYPPELLAALKGL